MRFLCKEKHILESDSDASKYVTVIAKRRLSICVIYFKAIVHNIVHKERQ